MTLPDPSMSFLPLSSLPVAARRRLADAAVDLWLDIGNTRVKYWLMQAEAVVEQGAELHLQSPADFLMGLQPYFAARTIRQVGIASVQDSQTNRRIHDQLAMLGCPIQFVQVRDHWQGLQLGYHEPQKLGIDRWLHLLALSGQGRFLIAGCGTALTLDLLDGRQHLGGYILPGLYLQRESLVSGTRRIQVDTGAMAGLEPGRDTSAAVLGGVALGLTGAISLLQQRFPDFRVVLTGGDAPWLAQLLQQEADMPTQVMPDLLLQGLRQAVVAAPVPAF